MNPYSEGFKARLRGEDVAENPHATGSEDSVRWIKGWADLDRHLNERDIALDSIGWLSGEKK